MKIEREIYYPKNYDEINAYHKRYFNDDEKKVEKKIKF